MEDKDQNETLPNVSTLGASAASESVGSVHKPPVISALSLEQTDAQQPLIPEERLTENRIRRFLRTKFWILLLLLAILILAGVVTAFVAFARNNTKEVTSVNNKFTAVRIPLSELLSGKDLALAGASNVTINGSLQVSGSFLLAPSLQPTGAKPGQIYYDRGSNQLAYFNGTNFIFLTGPQPSTGVQSLGGATGLLTLGEGLTLTNGQLSNGGILSIQGQAGAVEFTAGAGIVINGTNFSNSGVISIASGSANVLVADDGEGNVTISTTPGGTGTVTSVGGTAGTIPVFTTAQNIEDSIITQAGLAITVGGDLNVTGSLGLSSALTIANGGTGTNNLANNGVLVGQGSSAISSLVAGGAGLCLLSTAGAPTWGVCPGGGGGGVTSLNSLTGALNIANASAVGSTITIDDATTGSKGIASFDGSNFTVTAGAVNTIQAINTAATPTFAGVNTNNITPNATLTVGSTGQTLTLQGGASTTLRAVNGGNASTVSFQSPTANVTYRFLTAAAGTYDICTTAGNCVGVGGSVTTSGGTPNRLAKFSGSQAINDSSISDDGTTVTTSVDLLVQGGDITVGVPASQKGTLALADGGSSFLGSLTQGVLTANRTYTLPDASGTICLSTGNCPSSGVTSLNGLTGALNIANASAVGSTITIDNATASNKGIASFNNMNFTVTAGAVNTAQDINVLANPTFAGLNTNIITPNAAMTVGATTQTLTLQGGASTTLRATNGGNTTTVSFQPPTADVTYRFLTAAAGTYDICTTSGNCIGIDGTVITPGGTANRLAKFTGSQTIDDSSISDDGTSVITSVDVIVQGGDITVGVPAAQTGTIAFAESTSSFLGSLTQGALTANHTYTLPDASGIVCLSINNCPASGVISLNSLTGAISIANVTTLGSTITINDATTLTKGIASFNGSNFTVSSGVVNTIQDIGTGATPTFASVNTNAITPSGSLAIGANGQQLILQGNSATTLTANNGANATIVGFQAPTANVTYRFLAATAGTYDVCSTAGNCVGLGGTVSSTGGTANRLAKFSGAQAINDSTITDNGTNVTTSADLVIQGGDVTVGVANAQTGSANFAHSGSAFIGTIVQGALTANHTYTLPDASGTICLSSGNCANTGVTSLNGLAGALNIANTTATGSTITIDDATMGSKGIASFNGTNFVVASGAVNTIQDIDSSATPTFAGINANSLTPSSALTVGATAQSLLLQGDASTTLTANNGGNVTTVSFQSPTANVTYRFLTAPAGNYDICTTVGNCALTGGVTSTGGTTNRLAKFSGAQAINDSTITDNGTNVLTSIDMVIQGGDLTVGVPTTQTGTINLANNGSSFLGSIIQGALSANRAYTLPDSSGTICLSTGNCPASGVTTLNGLTGALSIANASATGSTITIDNATASNKGIASFNGTNFTVTSGAVNTIQDIHATAAPTFLGINTNTITPSGTLAVAGNIDVSGTLTAGTSNAFQVAANGTITTAGTAVITGASVTIGGASQVGSLVLNDGAGATGSLTVTALGQNTVYTLPDPGTASVSICLTSGNCAGTGGGVTTPGGSTNRLAKFSGGQTIADSTITDNGTNVTTSADLVIQGGDVTVGVTNAQTATINLAHSGSSFLGSILQGALTAGRTYTLPDSSGTICLSSGNCSGSGSSSTLQAAYDAGNLIATTDSRDLAFTLANTTTDANFTVDIATGGTGYVAFRRADGAGTADPAQLLLLENLDTNRAQPTGLRLQASGGGMATAIDATDAEIVTALSVAANDITGTTGNISFTNFTIDGATGNLTTTGTIISGLINGQTISSTANFTGSVTVGTSLNVNTITPSGALTVGSTAQALTLQGGAATKLTATSGANTSTLNFTVPTGNRTISLPDESGTVCLQSSANCGFAAGSGSGNYIQNQAASDQVANFRIDGTGRVGTALQAPLFDRATAGVLNIGTTNATSISLDKNATFVGDIAVNGGDITATGTLNITPGGTLTVGAIGQQLTLQGNASTQLTATGGGFTTTIGFNGTPTAAVTYNFDRTLAAGAYTICSTSGNCAGIGGGVTSPGGTTGRIAKFTGTQTIGDSLLSETGSTVTVSGNVNVTTGNQFQINGTQISSTALSNDANLAKLNASQTFTGNGNIFRNAANSTTAFRIQNSSSQDLFSVDSSNTLVRVSGAGSDATLTSGTGAFQIGTDAGQNLAFDQNEIIARNNGATGTLSLQDGGGSLTVGADVATYQNANNSDSAFQIQNAAGAKVFGVSTSTGSAVVGQASTLNGVLVFYGATNSNAISLNAATATGSRTVTLPNETGTVCLQASTNCGFAASTGSTNYIQNQNSSDQTANFRISGTGRALALQASTIDVAAAGALGIGTTTATTVNLATNAATHTVNIATSASAAQTVAIGSTNVGSTATLQGNTVTLDTPSSGTINIGNANLQTINIGNNGLINNNIFIGTNATSNSSVNVGSTASTSNTLVQGGTGGTAVSVQAGTGGSIIIGTTNNNVATIANINVPTTAGGTGMISKNGVRWIHNAGDITNFFAGNASGNLTTTGFNNVAIGSATLQGITSGFFNVGVGTNSLMANTVGTNNTAHGDNTLQANIDGDYNSAFGSRALFSSTDSDHNTGIGGDALYTNSTGDDNVALGYQALTANDTGNRNIAVGTGAGLTSDVANANVSGNNNLFIGYNAGPGSTTQLSNAGAIGTNAVVSQSNAIVIGCVNGVNGCTNRVRVGLGIAAPQSMLHIDGTTGNNAFAQFTAGTTTGQTSSDGFAVGVDGAGTAYLQQREAGNMVFHTSNTLQMLLDSSGHLGIGQTVPGYLLHVGSSAVTTGTAVARFQNAGGTCTITPSTAGGVTCTSDIRLKKNIQGFSGALGIIDQIDVKTYNMLADKDTDQKQIGVIAQQLEKVLPGLVVTDKEGLKSVSYSGLTPVLLQAIKEQQAEIDELKKTAGVKSDNVEASAPITNGLSFKELILASVVLLTIVAIITRSKNLPKP